MEKRQFWHQRIEIKAASPELQNSACKHTEGTIIFWHQRTDTGSAKMHFEKITLQYTLKTISGGNAGFGRWTGTLISLLLRMHRLCSSAEGLHLLFVTLPVLSHICRRESRIVVCVSEVL
eukprot:TRINITY_DN388_c0_g1_i1.p2 TRINITY_DN388_c0_g1~~TRINITY_DN388_c0_g1_i1.p2  ORF type:complete len:120 (-),score=9.28 TRINITY_DN388_c0_g1_i1:652-1011(-)